MGYWRAGFDIVGVDIADQYHYPFHFIQADALSFPLDGYDAIHASPPCQHYSVTRHLHRNQHPDLIQQVRERLMVNGVPYVIENVVGARLIDPLLLCGSSFGIGVRRHRLFETSPVIALRPPCAHHLQPHPIDVTGGGPTKPGRTRASGGVSRKPKNRDEAATAMGIDWHMTRAELNQAIPPTYTAFIGESLLASLEAVA